MNTEHWHLRKTSHTALPLTPGLPRRTARPFDLEVDAEFAAMLLGSHTVNGEGEVSDEDKAKGYFVNSGSLSLTRAVRFPKRDATEAEMRAKILRLFMNSASTEGGHARHLCGESASCMRLDF